MMEVGKAFVSGGQEGLCVHCNEITGHYLVYFPFGEVASYALFGADGSWLVDLIEPITARHHLPADSLAARPSLTPQTQRAPRSVPMESEARLIGENIRLRNTLKFFATPEAYLETRHIDNYRAEDWDVVKLLFDERELMRPFIPVLEDGLRLAQKTLLTEEA
jgi:hypothetical protein